MSVKRTTLGPGTISIDIDGTPLDFSCQVTKASIKHKYDDIGDPVDVLCGDRLPAGKSRADTFNAEIIADLSAAGLIAALYANDLKEAAFTFTPKTGNAAAWTGQILLSLPTELGADVGANIAGEIEWETVGKLTFTPDADAAGGGGEKVADPDPAEQADGAPTGRTGGTVEPAGT